MNVIIPLRQSLGYIQHHYYGFQLEAMQRDLEHGRVAPRPLSQNWISFAKATLEDLFAPSTTQLRPHGTFSKPVTMLMQYGYDNNAAHLLSRDVTAMMIAEITSHIPDFNLNDIDRSKWDMCGEHDLFINIA